MVSARWWFRYALPGSAASARRACTIAVSMIARLCSTMRIVAESSCPLRPPRRDIRRRPLDLDLASDLGPQVARGPAILECGRPRHDSAQLLEHIAAFCAPAKMRFHLRPLGRRQVTVQVP